jgi:tellurite resistance protein TehA-like permease
MSAGCGPVTGGHVLARAVRRARPGSFTVVMATGIVSAALRQAGQPSLSAVLLVIAAAVFVILLAASAVRAVAFLASLRADLDRPDRAFTSFAFVAACGVLGDRLASGGYRLPAAAAAGAALAAWLGVTCLVPARLAVRRPRARLDEVNGTWYLWAVGTQSLAITAVFLHGLRLLPAGPAALAAVAAWSAGILLYLVITVLVAGRLLLVGVGPREAANPYWVAMGAASIGVVAAAGILRIPGAPARAAITGLAVALWSIATVLIPPLATATAARYLRRPVRPRYRVDMWTVVFPLGMYAMAGLQLGSTARLPLVDHIGAVAVPCATAAWALTFIGLATSPLDRRHACEDRKETISRYDRRKDEPRPGRDRLTQGGDEVEEENEAVQVPGSGQVRSARRRHRRGDAARADPPHGGTSPSPRHWRQQALQRSDYPW